MHTSACRNICLCNNPDRLCMAEREALLDSALILDNLSEDFSHFKTPRLRQLYCAAVYKHCGGMLDPNDVKAARNLYLEYEANKVKKVELTTPFGFFRKQLLEMQANWAENREKVKTQHTEEMTRVEERRNIHMAEAWWLEIMSHAWRDFRWKTMSDSYQLACTPETMGEYQHVMTHNNIRHPFEIWKLRNQSKFKGLNELKRYVWERSGKPTNDKHRSANMYTHATEWLMRDCRSLLKLWPSGRVNDRVYAEADQFYVTVKETLYSDPWSTVMSRDLGLNYTESAKECSHLYAMANRIHPFFDWATDKGMDLDNNPVDRVILFNIAGSPHVANYIDAIVRLIRMLGEPFIPHLPQFQTEEESVMAKATEETKSDVEICKDENGWYLWLEGKRLPIKLGGMPKRDSVYTEPFYKFVDGGAKIGFNLRDDNYSVQVDKDFEITWISSVAIPEVIGLMVPRDHALFDLIKVEVDASRLLNG